MRIDSFPKWIWALLLLALVLKPSELWSAAYFDVSGLQPGQNINTFGRVLLDTTDRSVQELDALFETEGQEIPELLWGGYRDGFYWVRLNLANESSSAQTVHLITANRLTSHFEYFVPDSDQKSKVGIHRVRAKIPTLELTLPPGQKLRLLMKLQFGLQDTVNFHMEWPPVDEMGDGVAKFNAQELVFGIILGLLFFNVGLYILTREPVFILHAMAASMVFAVVFFLSGLTYYYFGVDHWNTLLPVAGNLAVAGNNAFGQVYLNTRKSHPRIHHYFNIGLGIGIIGAVILLCGGSKKVIYVTDLNLLAIIGIGIATVFLFPPNRYRVMRFYVLGWLGLAASCLIWLASEYAIVERSTLTENVINLGLGFEMIVVSLGLADQINHYKNSLSEYNRNLEHTIEEKTRDIRSIMEYIPMGVFMIQSENRIHKDHSQHMRDIFPIKDLEQKPATEVLFERFLYSSDDKSQAVSTIVASLGEHIINFEANAHMLPLELRDQDNRIWDLTWNAIQGKDGRVEKILVTMREVTELRKLLEHNQAQQEELELIGEIIAISPQRFQRFVRSAQEMLQDNAYLLMQADTQGRPDVLKNLFINAHTIKGAARSLYFKNMTQMLHEMEQSYAALQRNPDEPWDLARMKTDVAAVQQLLAHYESIAREKLGRNLDQSRSIEFSVEQAELSYYTLGHALHEQMLTPETIYGLEQLRTFLHQHVFRSAHDVFEEICDCLPTLARDLNKENPVLELHVDGFYVKDQAEDVLRNIFVHLLRNSMDHGIEPVDERMRQLKPAKGLIKISMHRRNADVLVIFEDDGRGLNLAKIKEIALERRLISAADSADPSRVAGLIFDAGLSTAQQVTEISGRGVGMNAVKRFAQMHQGGVFIHLEGESQSTGYYRFQFHIVLPARLFDIDELAETRKLA